MNSLFQKDILKMKVQCLRSMVRNIEEGGTIGVIRMTGSVLGLGPNFKINMTIENQLDQPLKNVSIISWYKLDIFEI